MLPRHDHAIYENNNDGTYTMYKMVPVGTIPAGHPNCPMPGIAPWEQQGPKMGRPADFAAPIGGIAGDMPRAGAAVAGAAAVARQIPQIPGLKGEPIPTDHGVMHADDPRILFVCIARRNAEDRIVPRDAAAIVLKAMGVRKYGQFVRKAGDGIEKEMMKKYWYFRITQRAKHDKDAPKVKLCVEIKGAGMDGCRVYIVAQDMSKRAKNGKYKEVAPLQMTGAEKATRK